MAHFGAAPAGVLHAGYLGGATQQGTPRPQAGDADDMPQFGATFVPGGLDDDYYMPEVVAPSPQRVMPEVPQNMQDDLQRMELEAKARDPARASQDSGSFRPFTDNTTSTAASVKSEMPSFSPFPRVGGDNIPLSDEEKQEVLYNAREHVLHSDNVSMQLSWARDTLMWVEVAAEAREREAASQKLAKPHDPTKVENELRNEAVNVVNYLAHQEHPEATFIKAKWMEFGKFDQPQDKREAYNLYRKAADMGWGRAEYRIGMFYENGNDIERAIQHYNIGVAKKDSAAQYRLGMMSLMGQHGYRKDFQKGLELIQRAADSADEDAPQGAYVYGMLIARDLPDMHIPETVLPYDLGVARQYIEKAAYLGFAKAQLKMGQAYELCQLGCDFNPTLSLHYYGLSARQGQPEAALGVSRWFLFGHKGLFAKNEQLAFQYAELAAWSKLATGEFALGYYYEIGIHVSQDLHEARIWYEKAADHGNKDAVGRLQSLNESKTLTKQDHETTTMTRIKSQHGSQRGKRPDRFAKPNQVLPTLNESEADAAGTRTPPAVPAKVPSPRVSPSISPRASPQQKPTQPTDNVDMPDPSRLGTMNGTSSRPPAFVFNVNQDLPARPKSSAPYPDDDRPAPLNIRRPSTTAPYPDDDVVGAGRGLAPQADPANRLSQGPVADRPGSAFGIRPISSITPGTSNLPSMSSGSGPGPRPLSAAMAVPTIRADPPAGTGWEPQVPSGYRQPSPHRQPSPQRQPGYDQQPPVAANRLSGSGPSSGPPPVGDPARNRLQKQNPSHNKPQPSPPPPQFPQQGYGPAGPAVPPPVNAAHPGRDYGPRVSSRPVSDNYDRYGAPPASTRPLPYPATPIHAGRVDSLPATVPAAQGGMGAQGRLLKQPPQQQAPLAVDAGGHRGRQSAPPAQGIPPVRNNQRISGSPAPNMAGHGGNMGPGAGRPVQQQPQQGYGPGRGGGGPAPPAAPGPVNAGPHPDGKTFGQGPATFEEMGIPQGKNEGDCVVM